MRNISLNGFAAGTYIYILVGVIVPVAVIGVVILILFLKRRAGNAQRNSTSNINPATDTVPGSLNELSNPPAYEDIELHDQQRAVSGREYDAVADTQPPNQQVYVNFQPSNKDNSNQYETLQLPSNSSDADEGHVYAEAKPTSY